MGALIEIKEFVSCELLLMQLTSSGAAPEAAALLQRPGMPSGMGLEHLVLQQQSWKELPI